MSAPPPEWMFVGWPMSVWSVVVAALGVVASTAVAIAAFTASRRANKIAIQNRADSISDGRRHERRDFYNAAKRWLAAAGVDVLGHHRTEFPHELKEVADLIDSSTAHEIVWWIDNGQRAVVSAGSVGSTEVKNAYETFMLLFGRYGAQWVSKDEFEWEPYTAPPP